MLTFKNSIVSALALTTLLSTTSAFAGFKPIEDLREERANLRHTEAQAYKNAAAAEAQRQIQYDEEEFAIKLNAKANGIPLEFKFN